MKVERRQYFLHREFNSIPKSERWANLLSDFGGDYRTQYSMSKVFIWGFIGKENLEQFLKEEAELQ